MSDQGPMVDTPPDDDRPPAGPSSRALAIPTRIVAELRADTQAPIQQFLDQCDGYNLVDVVEGIFTLGPELLAMIGVYSRQMGIRKANTHTDIRVHWGNGIALRADFIPVHAVRLHRDKGAAPGR